MIEKKLPMLEHFCPLSYKLPRWVSFCPDYVSFCPDHHPQPLFFTQPSHPKPTPKHPFSWPELESGQYELPVGQFGPQLGKSFGKWACMCSGRENFVPPLPVKNQQTAKVLWAPLPAPLTLSIICLSRQTCLPCLFPGIAAGVFHAAQANLALT